MLLFLSGALVPLWIAPLGGLWCFSIFCYFCMNIYQNFCLSLSLYSLFLKCEFLLSSLAKPGLQMKVDLSFLLKPSLIRTSESAATSSASGFRSPGNPHFIKFLLKNFTSWQVVPSKTSASVIRNLFIVFSH